MAEHTGPIQIKSTHTLQCPANQLSVKVLQEYLDGLDPTEVVRVRTANPDRPGELSMVYLEASFDFNQGRIY
jgi:hypothetical protein